MKIEIIQYVCFDNPNKNFRIISKTFDSNIIPNKGDFISDPLFKKDDGYEVKNININYSRNICYITISPYPIQTEEELKDYVQIAKLHDWQSI